MAPLFVVSDVHGHRDDLLSGLVDCDLVSSDGRWTGADAQLWLLGDMLDRGPDGIGVVDAMMSLQAQAPEQVHVLMGNHEALAVGTKRFPDSDFAQSWIINGGVPADQDGLSETHLDWLAGLPSVAQVEDYLLLHSDTAGYLAWGSTVADINATVAAALASDDFDRHWEVWARLTDRFDFARRDGAEVAGQMLERLGGNRIVHGHSIIGMLTNRPSEEVSEPVLYADGRVLAIDGGRYDGGPLLFVRLS